MHHSSYAEMLMFRNKYLSGKEDKPLLILDVGSRDVYGSYRKIFEVPGWRYIGMDIEPGKNVDVVIKDLYEWKEFPNNYADVIISGQAMEHIEYFWLTFKEIARVLKPGGLCCVIAPSSGPEHKFPVDCWRFFEDGFRALAKWANLTVVSACTCDRNPKYADNSDLWRDTILVAEKPLS